MRIVRLYSGDDGESHFEDLGIALESGPSLAFPVTTLDFRQAPVEHEPDWHNASNRQFVITLSGALEVEIGDGSRRQLRPGDVLLAEDLTGHGHVSRTIAAPRRSVVIPITEDTNLVSLLNQIRANSTPG
jgi:quercetin dioxygenase-like cupin family protein